MTNFTDALSKLLEFTGAIYILSGAMSWFRQGSDAEDEMVAGAADVVINSVTSADLVNRVEMSTGKNLRDQISVQELEDLNRERELRRFRNRN